MSEIIDSIKLLTAIVDHISEEAWTLEAKLARAERALVNAGFTNNGGKEWKPPVNTINGKLVKENLDLRDKIRELEHIIEGLEK